MEMWNQRQELGNAARIDFEIFSDRVTAAPMNLASRTHGDGPYL